MFTGASSVTTTLLWMVWHIATDKNGLKNTIRAEAHAAAAAAVKAGDGGSSAAWLDGSGKGDTDGLVACPVLDAVLRETLRMYPPIHIGRLSVKPFTIKDKQGRDVTIPKGTDIFSNMWFVHRDPALWPDPHTFSHARFMGQPFNMPGFHPFSMGVRACPGQRIAFIVLKVCVLCGASLLRLCVFRSHARIHAAPRLRARWWWRISSCTTTSRRHPGNWAGGSGAPPRRCPRSTTTSCCRSRRSRC